MDSCDLLLFLELVRGVNYDEAVLCAGLTNQLFVSHYSDKRLYMVQGRGILFIDDLFDRLKLAYRRLTIDELVQADPGTWSRTVLILPYVDFAKIKDYNPRVVQFMNLYSTYRVESVHGGEIRLRGMDESSFVTKTLAVSDLYRLAELKVKPLSVSHRILHVQDEAVDKAAILDCVRANWKELLVDDTFMDNLGGWVRGAAFYDAVRDRLAEDWNRDFNRVAKFVFFQSMLNGSSFFYRREYANALANQRLADGDVIQELYSAGNQWRKLSRYLRGLMMEEKPLDEELVRNYVCEISHMEKRAFQALLATLEHKVGTYAVQD